MHLGSVSFCSVKGFPDVYKGLMQKRELFNGHSPVATLNDINECVGGGL